MQTEVWQYVGFDKVWSVPDVLQHRIQACSLPFAPHGQSWRCSERTHRGFCLRCHSRDRQYKQAPIHGYLCDVTGVRYSHANGWKPWRHCERQQDRVVHLALCKRLFTLSHGPQVEHSEQEHKELVRELVADVPKQQNSGRCVAAHASRWGCIVLIDGNWSFLSNDVDDDLIRI